MMLLEQTKDQRNISIDWVGIQNQVIPVKVQLSPNQVSPAQMRADMYCLL